MRLVLMWIGVWSWLSLVQVIPAVPLTISDSTSASQSLTAELELREKIRYEVQVLIGSPPQSFPLALDTTVSYLAVMDSDCSGCKTKERFHRNDSVSYQETEKIAMLNVTGRRGNDVVSVGGLTVSQQSFISIEQSPGSLLNSPVGVLVRTQIGTRT